MSPLKKFPSSRLDIPDLVSYQDEYPADEYGTMENRWGTEGYLVCDDCGYQIVSHSSAGARGKCPDCESACHWRLFPNR